MFAGQLYSRWSRMEGSIWIVFQYLVNQLVAGNYKDLVILRELISRMTGFEPFADLADAQVNSLAGGKLLRSEVFYQTEISHASNRQNLNALASSRNRLVAAVRRSGLAMPLLVNIAVQRQACVSDTEPHLKSLGGLFDGVRPLPRPRDGTDVGPGPCGALSVYGIPGRLAGARRARLDCACRARAHGDVRSRASSRIRHCSTETPTGAEGTFSSLAAPLT